jgi:uncharacterized protein YaiL (DUF2058 family)
MNEREIIMAGSLRDQLLQAGLVTEEQVTKAETEKKNRNKKRFQAQKNNKTQKNKPSNKPKKKKAPQSDLAKFYQQRTNQERKEKQEAEKQKQKTAQVKKERRQKIGKLIKAHAIQTTKEGEIRYNFVVGTNIKYMFVTEDQQQQLSEGKIAITFLGGKKILIPAEVVPQIHEIDPQKIISLAKD